VQDHTLFKKKGRTECPAEARCLNCMPKPGKDDDYECWAIKKPVMYKVGFFTVYEGGGMFEGPGGGQGGRRWGEVLLGCWAIQRPVMYNVLLSGLGFWGGGGGGGRVWVFLGEGVCVGGGGNVCARVGGGSFWVRGGGEGAGGGGGVNANLNKAI
jgi:hypothetical protein